jgi:hypothetical protein
MNEQRIANCISMDGNEETVAVEWPGLRKRVFDFLCRYQWRVGEKRSVRKTNYRGARTR